MMTSGEPGGLPFKRGGKRFRVSRGIVWLGLASLLAELPEQALFVAIPLQLAALGAPGIAIGLVGGLGDGVAELVKVVSGRWSDFVGRRRRFVIAGYALAAASKLGIALAGTWGGFVVYRALERAGKGIREPPRDALLSEHAGTQDRGGAFGFTRLLDGIGALLGIGLAVVGVFVFGWSVTGIMLASAGLAWLALAPLFKVQEGPATPRVVRGHPSPYTRRFKLYALVAAIYALGYVSMLFFLTRSADVFPDRWKIAGPIILYALFMLTYAVTTYPLGILSDRIGRAPLLVTGFALHVAACGGFILTSSVIVHAVLYAALGVAYGVMEGTQRAMTIDLAGPVGRATASGAFQAAVGFASIVSGLAAGFIWDLLGPAYTFGWSALMAAVALVLALAFRMPRWRLGDGPSAPT